jgi:hypothetical protein
MISEIHWEGIEIQDDFSRGVFFYDLETKEKFPTRQEKVLIYRMTNGITKKKMKTGWYRCGQRQKGREQIHNSANKIATAVVSASSKYGLNPWGVLGTSEHEAGLDECALGAKPRKWGYKHGYLKKTRASLSHKKEPILKMLASKAWKRTKIPADLGPLQLLDRFYHGKTEDMMSVEKGVEIGARAMSNRAKQYRRVSSARFYHRPWRRWKMAIRELNWYDRKVTRCALSLGAKRTEI